MNSKDYNLIFKDFKQTYRGQFFEHLNYINDVKQGDLEIIVEFNKSQETINDMNLPTHYKEVSITYQSNPNREVKIIPFQGWQTYKQKKEQKKRSERFFKKSDHLDQ